MISKITLTKGTKSVALAPENGYYIQSFDEIGYNTKYPTSELIQNHGLFIGKAYYKNKVLGISIQVGGASYEQLFERRKALYEVLQVGGDTDTTKVIATLVSGIEIDITGVVKSLSNNLSTSNLLSTPVAFTIETDKWYFTGSQEYEVRFGITQGGGFAIPFSIPLNMSAGAGNYTEITNGGSIYAFPEITLHGPLTNPIIRNRSNSLELSIEDTLLAGEWIKIFTETRIVYDNNNVNFRSKMSGDFIRLDVGANQLELSSDNSAEAGYCLFNFKYPYISL